MRFAKIVFSAAGVWGLLILTPLLFLFDHVGRQYPPPITHADLYYGFLAVTLAWQVAFLTIATDPPRFRLLILPAILEKFGYVAVLGALYAQQRLQPGLLAAAVPEVVLGLLFIEAFRRTAERAGADQAA